MKGRDTTKTENQETKGRSPPCKTIKQKITIIRTTHYLEEVEALSDRIGIMANGKLTAIGTVAELTQQTGTSKLEDAFVILSGGAA